MPFLPLFSARKSPPFFDKKRFSKTAEMCYTIGREKSKIDALQCQKTALAAPNRPNTPPTPADTASVAMGTIRTRILKGFFISRTLAAADVAMGTIRTRILKDVNNRVMHMFIVVAMGTIRTRILKGQSLYQRVRLLRSCRNGHDPHEDTESKCESPERRQLARSQWARSARGY